VAKLKAKRCVSVNIGVSWDGKNIIWVGERIPTGCFLDRPPGIDKGQLFGLLQSSFLLRLEELGKCRVELPAQSGYRETRAAVNSNFWSSPMVKGDKSFQTGSRVLGGWSFLVCNRWQEFLLQTS
jgi:hypothetical protein